MLKTKLPLIIFAILLLAAAILSLIRALNGGGYIQYLLAVILIVGFLFITFLLLILGK